MNAESRSLRRRLTATVVAFVTVALVITGCRSAVEVAAPDPSATPVSGGTVNVMLALDAQPSKMWTTRGGNVPWVGNVIEPLVRKIPGTTETNGVLATEWTISDDAKSIDVTLREGVKFHTGKELTAADVQFTFETAKDPVNAAQFGYVANDIKSIDIEDDYHFTVTFNNPTGNVLDFFEGTPIVDSETWAGYLDGSQVNGTGPYIWEEWVPGATLSLVRNDDYWDDPAYIERIEYSVISDGTAQVSALRSGAAQLGGLQNSDAVTFEGGGFTLGGNVQAVYTFGMNITLPPFDNKDVRQAIGYAIDRERINDQVIGGLGTPGTLWWSPDEPGFDPELNEAYTYDPELAKKMIKDAGAEGAEFQIMLLANPLWQSTYDILQRNLEDVGLKPSAITLAAPEFDAAQASGNMGPGFVQIWTTSLSAASLMGALPPLRPGNPSQFNTDEYNDLRSDLVSATNPEDSAAAVEALSELMLEEAFTQPILQAPALVVTSDEVQGMEWTNRNVYLFHDAYLPALAD